MKEPLTTLLGLALLGCLAACGPGNPDESASGPEAAAEPAVAMEAAALKEPAEEGVHNRGVGKSNWWDALPRPEWQAFERLDDGAGWFEVYRIRPHVLAIYEPGQFEEVISYLILGTDRALLFDTGLGIGDIAEVTGPLTDLPVAVLNSHSHYDHIGGNHRYGYVYGPDSDYSRTHMKGLPHEEVAEAVSPGWIWKPLPAGFDPATFATSGYGIDEYVQDGTEIDLGGRTLTVLLTPGHTPDSLCLLDRAARLLFTGDTFYPAPLYAHLPGADVEAYRRSAHRLAGMAPLVTHLLPGHNVGLVGSEYLVRMAAAFDRIASGGGDYVSTDGAREYGFDGFSVIVPEPHNSADAR